MAGRSRDGERAGSGFGRRLAVTGGIVLLFLVAGPPIGAVSLFLLIGLGGLADGADLSGLGWIGLFGLIYGAPLSYLIGAPPAAAAGVLVGVRQAWWGRVAWPYAGLAGLVTGLGLLWLSATPVYQLGDMPVRGSGPFLLLTCLTATLACTGLVRLIARG